MIPVFIGGCARSGTTLLGSLLGGAPGTVCVPESQFKVSILREERRRSEPLDRDRTLAALEETFRFKVWGMSTAATASRLPERCSAADLLTALAHQYALQKDREGASVWIDHTPHNIRHVSLLERAFPEARFIHLVRDPRGVAASIKALDWGPNHAHTCATFWSGQVAFGLAAEELLRDKILRIRYEDLLRHPEAVLERACHFAGIEFVPDMVEGRGFHPPDYTAGQHRLVGAGLDPSRASAWVESLSDREVEWVESAVGELLGYFGYEARFGDAARPLTGRERLACALLELGRTEVTNRWRLRRRRARLARAAGPSPPPATGRP